MGDGTPLLELRSVSRVYSTDTCETHALARLDLDIAVGEFAAIVGPSGGGKSTLLAILGLLDRPTAGAYVLAGHETTGLSARQRAWLRNREFGFIFQQFHLLGESTALDNVALPLRYRSLKPRERRRLAAAALERVGLAARAGHYPNQLSGGQQQRVAIARAIVGGPRVVLADEPTGNLDSASGQAVIELLCGLHRDGTTVCLVTHDSRNLQHAGRTIELIDGRIAAAEAPAMPGVR